MSFENPTQLSIGMSGDFAGRHFKLIGRAVLGVDINGETYYWNEFHLEAGTGETSTLVYEETENGGEWRLFTTFEPDYPLTAEDAAQKQVGDKLNLTGINVSVTLVQTSRVYYVEGRAPDGVRAGSEANYFNAEAGDVMQVVSWTGAEVEYYNGLTLSRGAVEHAFKISRAAAPAKIFSRSGGSSSWDDSSTVDYVGIGKFLFWVVFILFLFFLAFGHNFSCSTSYEAAPVKRLYAPTPPLMTGGTGIWDGKNFHVTAHAVVEIGTVSAIYERHEYQLADDLGVITLLVCGEKPGAKDWTLYTPLTPLQPPSLQQSAAHKVGDIVNIDGVTATIHELFQATIKSVDNVAPTVWQQGSVRYGYAASSDYDSLLVRWNNSTINYLHGKNIPAKQLIAAFSATNSP